VTGVVWPVAPATLRAILLDQPWTLRFSGWRAPPERLTLTQPALWSELAPDRVRFHAGSGSYATQIDLPRHLLARDVRLMLDLGAVHAMAEVMVNGRLAGAGSRRSGWTSPHSCNRDATRS
jgi:hypothetical protein